VTSRPRVRFAPSPTGSLHLGNARTALFNWLVARRTGGAFVLRVEDTDTEREQEGSERAILEDLRWLGLTWDEGPDVGGPYGPYRQSERADRYAAAAQALSEAGRVYRCFCSEETLEAERRAHAQAGLSPGYSGRCREIPAHESAARAAAGEPCALRFRTIPRKPGPDDLSVRFVDRLRGEVVFPAVELGDPVLVRRDGRPTYNFAVVVDDIAMAIDLVLRGDDHLSNTPRQVLLFRALGGALPEFAHLPMVRGADGERLSKRHGASSVGEFRRMGYPPEAVLNAIALLGWAPSGDRTIVSLDEMTAEFDIDRIGRSAAVFDPAKLDWISGQHLHGLPAPRVVAGVRASLAQVGLLPEPLGAEGEAWLAELAELLRRGIMRFDQAPGRAAALFLSSGLPADAQARAVLEDPSSAPVLAAIFAALEAGEPETPEAWPAFKARVQDLSGTKGKTLFHALRAALTGEVSGPELDRLVPLIVRGSRLFPDKVPALAERARRAAAVRG
jgi:glutamyl-tRNA synthetase